METSLRGCWPQAGSEAQCAGRGPAGGSWPPRGPVAVGVCSMGGAEGGHRAGLLADPLELPSPPTHSGPQTELRTAMEKAETWSLPPGKAADLPGT